MKKRRELSDLKNQADSSLLISKLTKEELLALEKIKEIILPLKEKYNLTFEDIKGFVEKEEVVLPVSIFNEKLTLLESAVKYLKEEKNFTLHKISELINRDERNIWNIYNQAKKKYSAKFLIKDAKFFVPISIFSNEKLSAQEAVVSYMKEKLSLNYHQIAVLLKRDDRTIWTVYKRAREKYAK